VCGRLNVTHTHARLTALCRGLGLPGKAGTRKVKPIWILLKQESASGNGISWAICKSSPRSRQITMQAPHHSFFYRMPFLPPNQQRQSTAGLKCRRLKVNKQDIWIVPYILVSRTRQCRINHVAHVANATGLRPQGASGSRENFISPSVVK